MLSISALFFGPLLFAQVTEGTVTYTRTDKIEIQLPPEFAAQAANMPKEQKSTYELLFSQGKSLFRPAADASGDMQMDDGNGMQIRMIRPGANDKIYVDAGQKKQLAQRELGAKTYVVEDTLLRLNWKLTGESKKILGHDCRKATSTRILEKMAINNDNGVVTRELIKDTIDVVAWYATGIPSSLGPEYAGNLPGLILELSSDGGQSSFVATKIEGKYEKKALAEPKGGKKLTAQQFKAEQDAFFKKMQESEGPGGHWRSDD